MEFWLQAATAFKAPRAEWYTAPKPAHTPSKSRFIKLADFMDSEEGAAARKLVTAAKTRVLLGARVTTDKVTSITLAPGGLVLTVNTRGPVYPDPESKPAIINPERALELLQSFEPHGTEQSFLAMICRDLDKIGDRAPFGPL